MRVAALLFILGVGYLTFSGLFQNSVYYVGVSEALELTPQDIASARIFGTVQKQNLDLTSANKELIFMLEDSNIPTEAIKIAYKGIVPDTFEVGSEVFVGGKFDHQNNVFIANTLVTKCPSKYQKENRG